MRFKYYLRGCGLGILLAAIIFAIGFHRSKDEMSDVEIMQRASELGMITPKEEVLQTNPTQAKPAESETAEPTESKKAKDTEKSSGKDSEKEGKKDSEKDDEKGNSSKGKGSEKDGKETTSGEENSEKDEAKKIKIVVRRGEVCRELAEELFEQGLVPDAEEFRLFMQENGYDDLIRVGEFTFTVGMSQEEIAQILITKPE